MLEPPSATAVAVGIAISSTSRERTRQFRRIRRRGLAGTGLAIGGSARGEPATGSIAATWSRIGGGRAPGTGPSPRPAQAARGPAAAGPGGAGPRQHATLVFVRA